MKRALSLFFALVLLLPMMVIPQAEAASTAQALANAAKAEIGRTGAYYGFTDEWCARFVDYCASKAGCGASVPAQYNTAAMARWYHQNGGRFALTRRDSSGNISCWTRGTWSSGRPSPNYSYTPAVGDIVFFEANNNTADGIDHVGICVGVSGNTVQVVEGNTGSSNNSRSKVSSNSYNWKMNSSRIWGFARPSGFGAMPSGASSSSSTSTKITTGPQATVQKSGSTTAKISWSRVSNAKTYDVELYTAEGYSRMQAGASKAYILKKTGLTGTNYTAMKLQPGQTYVVQVAACNGSSWKFGNSVRFTMPNIQRMTIAQLIAKYDVRGYLCVSSNQRAFTTAALNKHDGSWIYTSDFCRILKSSGTSLLVEFPVSGGTKQRWIAADKFFGNFNYAVWSKTATRYIDVTSRAGGGKTFGTVFPDDQVYILQETGSYYQILYPVGAKWHVGYIPKSAL